MRRHVPRHPSSCTCCTEQSANARVSSRYVRARRYDFSTLGAQHSPHYSTDASIPRRTSRVVVMPVVHRAWTRRGAGTDGLGQCESVVGQTPHTPRHQNVAARRATARLSKPARAERARSRLPDALLWSLKFAENLSFRSASVAPHTHTSSPLANCPTPNSHCDGHAAIVPRGAAPIGPRYPISMR